MFGFLQRLVDLFKPSVKPSVASMITMQSNPGYEESNTETVSVNPELQKRFYKMTLENNRVQINGYEVPLYPPADSVIMGGYRVPSDTSADSVIMGGHRVPSDTSVKTVEQNGYAIPFYPENKMPLVDQAFSCLSQCKNLEASGKDFQKQLTDLKGLLSSLQENENKNPLQNIIEGRLIKSIQACLNRNPSSLTQDDATRGRSATAATNIAAASARRAVIVARSLSIGEAAATTTAANARKRTDPAP
jgi:hypothetical protein